ncbi:hypothetical protein [Prescottella equi]|uniref:hypothetical protein n=1 Tax=Rhodococcus hoagii TaxID=43767 RepID=UPI00111C8D14|nr:hypothetical protein [Prescottella equi]
MARVENKTGRSVRGIEIASELFDNGYNFCDTVQVDYSDGDSDDVYIVDLADFAPTSSRRSAVRDHAPS